MLKLLATEKSDLSQLKEWVAVDPWHKENETWKKTEGMLTGNGILAFNVSDDKGPVVYIRLDKEDDLARIATQFAPESEVSKRRLVVGLARIGIPAMIEFAKQNGYKGLIFESISPTLIGFGDRFGFRSVGNNDYALIFEEQQNV